MITNIRPPMLNAAGLVAIGYVSMNSGAAGTRPYVITATGPVQLSAVEWPSPVVGGQSTSEDALFGSTGAGLPVAFLTNNLGAGAFSGLYEAVAATTISGWTLVSTNTNTFVVESQPGGNHLGAYDIYTHGAVCFRVLYTAASPPVPEGFGYSTDGGVSWTTPANAGLAGGWVITAPTSRAYKNGAFVAISQLNGPGSPLIGTAKLSFDTGATWTAYTPGAEAAQAFEYDSAGGSIVIAATLPNMFGATGTLTIRTSPKAAPVWTSRQTFAISGTTQGVCIMRNVGAYTYLLIQLTAGGWTLHRATITSWATANPFSSVHAPGGTHAADMNSVPILFSDGYLRYICNGQVYKSADGSNGSWSADGGALSNTAGQLSPI